MGQTTMTRERLFALRETISRLEGKPLPAVVTAMQGAAPGRNSIERNQPNERLSLGVTILDDALDGGLSMGGISEIRSHLMRDAIVASGFAVALASLLQQRTTVNSSPVLWISDAVTSMETGIPYMVGLGDLGLKPEGFIHATPRKLEDALWLAEMAAESGAFSATILEVKGNPAHFGLTESRRLSLRAKAARRPLFLLRQSGEEEASSAIFRFLVEPAPATYRLLPDRSILGDSIGNPVFRLTLEKSRNPAPLSLFLEWNAHDRQFSLAAEPEHARSPYGLPAHSGSRFPPSSNRPDPSQEVGSVLAFERAS